MLVGYLKKPNLVKSSFSPSHVQESGSLALKLSKEFKNEYIELQSKGVLPINSIFLNFLEEQQKSISENHFPDERVLQILINTSWKKIEILRDLLNPFQHNIILSKNPKLDDLIMTGIRPFLDQQAAFEEVTHQSQNLRFQSQVYHQSLIGFRQSQNFIEVLLDFWNFDKTLESNPEDRCEWFLNKYLTETKPTSHHLSWQTDKPKPDLDQSTRSNLMKKLFQHYKFEKFSPHEIKPDGLSKEGFLRASKVLDEYHKKIQPKMIPLTFPLEAQIRKMIQDHKIPFFKMRQQIKAWCLILPFLSKIQDEIPNQLGRPLFGLLNYILNQNIIYEWETRSVDVLIQVAPETQLTLERMMMVSLHFWSNLKTSTPEHANQYWILFASLLAGTYPFDDASIQRYHERVSFLFSNVSSLSSKEV